MTTVLSCFDLVAVSIDHPVLIISTLFWTMEIYPKEMELTRICLSILLQASSMFTLLTLTIEIFLDINNISHQEKPDISFSISDD